MLIGAIAIAGIAFAAGWILKDFKWVKAAKTGKVMVVDGDLYKVKPYSETHGGSVEE